MKWQVISVAFAKNLIRIHDKIDMIILTHILTKQSTINI